jgi:hypothetical protein
MRRGATAILPTAWARARARTHARTHARMQSRKLSRSHVLGCPAARSPARADGRWPGGRARRRLPGELLRRDRDGGLPRPPLHGVSAHAQRRGRRGPAAAHSPWGAGWAGDQGRDADAAGGRAVGAVRQSDIRARAARAALQAFVAQACGPGRECPEYPGAPWSTRGTTVEYQRVCHESTAYVGSVGGPVGAAVQGTAGTRAVSTSCSKASPSTSRHARSNVLYPCRLEGYSGYPCRLEEYPGYPCRLEGYPGYSSAPGCPQALRARVHGVPVQCVHAILSGVPSRCVLRVLARACRGGSTSSMRRSRTSAPCSTASSALPRPVCHDAAHFAQP